MKTFTIDTENNVTAHASREAAGNSPGERFSSLEELAIMAANWPGVRLIQIWNSLAGVQPVRKFTSRQIAVRRIWGAIQNLQPTDDKQPRPAGASARRGANKASTGKNAVAPARGAKTERILSLLKQPSGATLKALMAETAWQAHSIRGFISGQVVKKMGLRVKSFERDGERVYAIR